jgi:glycerate 2-kinase
LTVILLAPDKFKGSLSAPAVTVHLRTGLIRGRRDLETLSAPVADGGEGTLDAVLNRGFTEIHTRARDPLGNVRSTRFAGRGRTAVIELAEISGLGLVPAEQRDALAASSYGVGEVIRAALDHGYRELIVAVGGSASTDGGAGLAQALGAGLLDARDDELPSGGGSLLTLSRADLSGLDHRLSEATITIASDVDNPLLGATGAARMYGPQKGATASQVDLLEQGLARWAATVLAATGRDLSAAPGAGAAGGVGYGLMALLGGRVRSGSEVVLEMLGFTEMLHRADLVITGEGLLDRQSLHGKAPVGVAAAALAAGVPTIAVVGHSALSRDEAAGAGFSEVHALTDREPDVSRSIAGAGPLIEAIAADIAANLPRNQPGPA